MYVLEHSSSCQKTETKPMQSHGKVACVKHVKSRVFCL